MYVTLGLKRLQFPTDWSLDDIMSHLSDARLSLRSLVRVQPFLDANSDEWIGWECWALNGPLALLHVLDQ